MEIIFCAGKNRRYAEIARDHGFLLGAQLPCTVYFPLWFADQNWKNPDRAAYMAALSAHRPHIASVLDLESERQLDEVLGWAEDAVRYAQVIMIIPKAFGIIERLPMVIGGKPVRLGYSVPTKHGGTEVPLWEFAGWPVHLLGGSPQAQINLSHYLDVCSVDGNMAMKMANQYGAFFDYEKRTARGYWPTLLDYDGQRWPSNDAPYEAFRRSCINIMGAWRGRCPQFFA